MADVYQIIQLKWFCVHIIAESIRGCVKIKSMDLVNMQMMSFLHHTYSLKGHGMVLKTKMLIEMYTWKSFINTT